MSGLQVLGDLQPPTLLPLELSLPLYSSHASLLAMPQHTPSVEGPQAFAPSGPSAYDVPPPHDHLAVSSSFFLSLPPGTEVPNTTGYKFHKQG